MFDIPLPSSELVFVASYSSSELTSCATTAIKWVSILCTSHHSSGFLILRCLLLLFDSLVQLSLFKLYKNIVVEVALIRKHCFKVLKGFRRHSKRVFIEQHDSPIHPD